MYINGIKKFILVEMNKFLYICHKTKNMKRYLLLILIICTSFVVPSPEKDYKEKADELREMAKRESYNTEKAILVDYSIPSGKRRLFIYNLKTDEIEKGFLVAQGDGCPDRNGVPTFSNEIGSNCSSVGISLLGGRDYSNWGIKVKYWLEGKSYTNSNMRKRVVVLHSWKGIPDKEVYPFDIPRSQGCFTVSNKTMKHLDKLIQKQENKRILIYSFK
jgi:hypothetical protein